MNIHKQPHLEIAPVPIFSSRWKREFWEWLLAVAAMTIGVWFFFVAGQAIWRGAFEMLGPVR